MLILTALSLLLCVVTVALWVRSYWYQTVARFYLPSASAQVGVVVNDGHLIIVVHSFAARPARAFEAGLDLHEPVNSSIRHASGWTGTGGWDREQMGFGMSSSPARGWRRRVLIVPVWFVAVLLIAAAAWSVRAFLRSRIAGGACAVCGYDLRATPDRCPECGCLVRRAT
jgi:hypothetical protein